MVWTTITCAFPSYRVALAFSTDLDLLLRYELKYKAVLPTHDQIGIKLAADVDARAAAQSWLDNFASACQSGDADAFADSFSSTGHWRDRVAFTFGFRTFNEDKIREAAQDTVPSADAHDFKLIDPVPALQTPYPDVSYIQAHFECESLIGSVSSSLLAHLLSF